MIGDNFAGELAKEPVRRAGIGYELAKKHKSELYGDPFLPMLNANKITLPRHERAINQICSLERSLQRTGREQITHPIHGHDDCANSIAGAVDLVYSQVGYDRLYRAFQSDWVDPDRPTEQSSQPELTDKPRYNGDWWRWKAIPRSTPTYSANERLLNLYKSLKPF